ncbi:hypothetical protein [Nocardia sp. NPDC052112]
MSYQISVAEPNTTTVHERLATTERPLPDSTCAQLLNRTPKGHL